MDGGIDRPESPGTGGVPLRFGQTGRALPIVGLAVGNALLGLVTLSLFRFWARTRVRRYLWQTSFINGEPLDYSGKGSELFVSFLMAIGLFIAPALLVSLFLTLWAEPGGALQVLGWMAASGLLGVLYGYATYRQRGYILSRTHWRGIRFAQSGSAVGYGLALLGYLLLVSLTFGLFTPVMNNRLVRRLRTNTWFGDARFAYDGKALPLFWRFLAAILAAIVVIFTGPALLTSLMAEAGFELADADPEALGVLLEDPASLIVLAVAGGGTGLVLLLIGALYRAFELNYMTAHTSIGGVRFAFRATGLSLLWLWVGNVLIIALTFGIGLPFALVRVMRYRLHRLSAEGTLELDAIGQAGQPVPRWGEGLADMLGLMEI
ncbi:MAG: DUF898 family protein [Alphaproteobacteria bacterium]|nr:DUF898 family protein [Alphaproteobacteria bacterium]